MRPPFLSSVIPSEVGVIARSAATKRSRLAWRPCPETCRPSRTQVRPLIWPLGCAAPSSRPRPREPGTRLLRERPDSAIRDGAPRGSLVAVAPRAPDTPPRLARPVTRSLRRDGPRTPGAGFSPPPALTPRARPPPGRHDSIADLARRLDSGSRLSRARLSPRHSAAIIAEPHVTGRPWNERGCACQAIESGSCRSASSPPEAGTGSQAGSTSSFRPCPVPARSCTHSCRATLCSTSGSQCERSASAWTTIGPPDPVNQQTRETRG